MHRVARKQLPPLLPRGSAVVRGRRGRRPRISRSPQHVASATTTTNVPQAAQVSQAAAHSAASAATASASVSALGDGSYAVGYSLRQAGVWALSVFLNGEPLERSPFAIEVWPAPLHPPTCDVAGHLHEAVAGVPGEIEVRARDRFGNRLREGGARLQLQLQPELQLELQLAAAVLGESVGEGGGGRETYRRSSGRHAAQSSRY